MNFSTNDTVIPNGTHPNGTIPEDWFNLPLHPVEVGFWIVLALCIVIGNGLVCKAVYSFAKLRTVTNLFVVSLAVSDILVGVCSIPLWIFISLESPEPTNPGYVVYLILDILCGTASITNMVLISLERWLSVSHPTKHRNLSHTVIYIAVAVSWTYALIVSLMFLKESAWYAAFVGVASYLLPLLIIILTYMKIYSVARAHTKKQKQKSFAKELRIAVTLGVVIGAFVIAWSPFFVLIMISNYSDQFDPPDFLLKVIKWLHYGNSTVNPIIYTYRNASFRNAFASILCKCMRNRQFKWKKNNNQNNKLMGTPGGSRSEEGQSPNETEEVS